MLGRESPGRRDYDPREGFGGQLGSQCLEGSSAAKQDKKDLSFFLVLLEGVVSEPFIYFVSLSRLETSLYLRAYLLLYYFCIL